MVRAQGSVVLVSLLMAVAAAGCASYPDTSHPSAAPRPSAGGDSVEQYYDGAGTSSSTFARPRLSDFAAHPDVRDVHFAFDSYEIRPGDVKILDHTMQWLKTHPDAQLVIEGHADERGTNEYNLALGERRAKASMNYLVSRGVQATRIMVLSYGEERNVCHEKTEGCWSQNRRAHFRVKSQ